MHMDLPSMIVVQVVGDIFKYAYGYAILGAGSS